MLQVFVMFAELIGAPRPTAAVPMENPYGESLPQL